MSCKVRAVCLKCGVLALFLLFLQPVFAQYNFQAFDQEWQAKQKLLGKDAVIMLWKDTLVYKKEAGDLKSKSDLPIGNASQWLTAALVMQFVDEGKLSLDDKVARWLPEFERYNKNYVTVRLCLSHMTGISDEKKFMKTLLQRTKFPSLEEEVNSFAKREIRTNPGEDFWYGNIGINIVGRVLEVISKKKFDVLIKTKLFNVIGMRKTTFTNIDNSAINPSGGAVSTPDDYMKFLVMLLNKGKSGDKQVLSEAAVEQLKEIQTKNIKISYIPKEIAEFGCAPGAWVMEEKDGKATTLASPSLFGIWPMIDFCRGYAYLVFVKELLRDEKAETHLELKKLIDDQIHSTCK